MRNIERKFELHEPVTVTGPTSPEEIEDTLIELTQLVVGKRIDRGNAMMLANLKPSALEEIKHVYDGNPPVTPPPADSMMRKQPENS